MECQKCLDEINVLFLKKVTDMDTLVTVYVV